jgi:hypothetical protein
VAAARPLLAQIAAPVLSAILRKRLSELAGLPEGEMRGLLAVTSTEVGGASERRERPQPDARPNRVPYARTPVRRPPSLTRQLIQGLVLQPGLAKSLPFPRPDDRNPEAATLTSLVAYCAEADRPLTTAAVLQAFADTPHAAVLSSVLAAATDHRLDDVAIEAEVRDGLERWWQQARRSGMPAPAAPASPAMPEENRRVQQLDYVRQRAAERGNLIPTEGPDGRPGEDPARDTI